MNGKYNHDKAKAKFRRVQIMEDRFSIKLDELFNDMFVNGIPSGGVVCQKYRTRQYADSLQISYDARGNASVSINGSRCFGIPPVLGLLLPILALETSDGFADSSDGQSVPWKSFEEVRSKMTQALGREFTDRALKEAVHRLRIILEDRDFDGLVHTDRLKRAYRFGLRRKCTTALAVSQ